MRFSCLCLACILLFCALATESQPPESIEVGRRALAAAFPQFDFQVPPTVTALTGIKTTALGCDLLDGLPLASAIDAYRLEFWLGDFSYAAHVSADGSLAQICDARAPNFGAGVLPVPRPAIDSDGDGLPDALDNCPQRAGDVSIFTVERLGCPIDETALDCSMRPRQAFANVREAPQGRRVGQIQAHAPQTALGRNAAGDWLFYRAGWVSRSALLLVGDCERLPLLDPAEVASGVIFFCPPGYAGFLRPRIGIGPGAARIVSTTQANRLRAAPAISAEKICEIPPGSVVDVLDGPACNAPFIWWQVEVAGQVGWTVESDYNANHYYLEPAAQPSAALALSKQLPVAALSFRWSPSGEWLALINEAGALEIYRYPDFALLTEQAPDAAKFTAIAFHPDGDALAIGAASGAVSSFRLTAAGPASDELRLGALAGPVRALAWSQSGEWLAAVSGAEAGQRSRSAGRLKLWQIAEPPQLALHYSYPYPLTAVAFSADGRWLALSGESEQKKRGALWIYDTAGALRFSKDLVYGSSFVISSPTAALGDFVYSSGDGLYQITVETGEDRRFYQQAGAVLRGSAFQPPTLPKAESRFAVTAAAQNSATSLHIANALYAYAPALWQRSAGGALAFHPSAPLLAVAEPDRVAILELPASLPRALR